MKKRFFGVLLTILMVAGMISAMSLTAYAYGITVNNTTINNQGYYPVEDGIVQANKRTSEPPTSNSYICWMNISATETVLTLHNAEIKGSVTIDKDVTIQLEGENSITASEGETHGISVDGSLKIEGEGSLTVTGGANASGDAHGIYVALYTTINGGTIEATGGTTASGDADGIYVAVYMTINGGTIEATGGTTASGDAHGICVNNFNTYADCTVTAKGGESKNGSANGLHVNGTFNMNAGKVTATGGTASVNAHGLCNLGMDNMFYGGTFVAAGGTADSMACGIYFEASGENSFMILMTVEINARGGTAKDNVSGIFCNYYDCNSSVVTAIGGTATAEDGISDGIHSYQTDGAITSMISSSEVNATAGEGGTDIGIYSGSNLNIISSHLTAEGKTGILAENTKYGLKFISGSTVEVTGTDSYGVDANIIEFIGDTAVVTVTGKEGALSNPPTFTGSLAAYNEKNQIIAADKCMTETSIKIKKGPPGVGSSFEFGDYKFKVLKAAHGEIGELELLGPAEGRSPTELDLSGDNSTVTYENAEHRITHIGEDAFRNYTALSRVSLTNSSVTTIGAHAFENCTSLTGVSLGNVQVLGTSAFEGCVVLDNLTIPATVTTWGDNVFSGCQELYNLNFEAGLKSIGSAEQENGVAAGGAAVFYGCTKLPAITIPESVEAIGNAAFANCTNLFNIRFPSYSNPALNDIGMEAFSGCKSLRIFGKMYALDIPDKVEKIGQGAFAGCTLMQSVEIPESVDTIGSQAFEQCSDLKRVIFESGEAPVNLHQSAATGEVGESSFPAHLYQLIVDDGTGDGYYAEGEKVTLTYTGTVGFLRWAVTSGDAAINNDTLTMGSERSTVNPGFAELIDGYYCIKDADELLWFAEQVNSGNTAINGKLMNDIDLAGVGYTPIGSESKPYTGTFDGQGYSIKNMDIDSTAQYQGLFGVVGVGVTIQNIIIDASCSVTGGNYTAAVVGGSVRNASGEVTIEKCVNYANVSGGQHTGGIFGCNTGDDATVIIRNCANLGNITGGKNCGTIAGYLGTTTVGTLENCWNTGTLTADSGDSFAHLDAANIENCYNLDTLTASTKEGVSTFTEEELASGALAYKLGGDWGQTIGSDLTPVLGGAKVYYGYASCGQTAPYTNSSEVSDTKPDHDFTGDGVCKCGEKGVNLKGSNLLLEGNIGLNFFFAIDETILEDTTIELVLADGRKFPYTASKATTNTSAIPGTTLYVFTCEVYAKQMADIVTAKAYVNQQLVGEFPHSVRNYAKTILTNKQNVYTEADINMVKAMLNYGANAQLNFQYNDSDLANEVGNLMSDAEKDVASVENTVFDSYAANGMAIEGIGSFAGSNLVLESETTLKVYFKPDNGVESSLTFAVNGEPVVPAASGEYLVISITDIKSDDLDSAFEVTVTNGSTRGTFTCSVFSYCCSVLRDTTGTYTDELKNVLKALYLYNQQANTYFN